MCLIFIVCLSVRSSVRVLSVSVDLCVCLSVELHTDLKPLHSCTFASLVSRLVMRT